MENSQPIGEKFASIIGPVIVTIFILAIPTYFAWDIIRDVFSNIPVSRMEFRRLIESDHGIMFYIFAGGAILWGLLFNVIYRVLLIVTMLIEGKSGTERFLTVLLGCLLLITGILPIASYVLISDSLYGYYFDFFQMLSFIGTFELGLLFVMIIEAFIGTSIITPITRIVLYTYLLIQFV